MFLADLIANQTQLDNILQLQRWFGSCTSRSCMLHLSCSCIPVQFCRKPRLPSHRHTNHSKFLANVDLGITPTMDHHMSMALALILPSNSNRETERDRNKQNYLLQHHSESHHSSCCQKERCTFGRRSSHLLSNKYVPACHRTCRTSYH